MKRRGKIRRLIMDYEDMTPAQKRIVDAAEDRVDNEHVTGLSIVVWPLEDVFPG
jgi:hypothetical protein